MFDKERPQHVGVHGGRLLPVDGSLQLDVVNVHFVTGVAKELLQLV